MGSQFHLLKFYYMKVMIMVLVLIWELRIINNIGTKEQAGGRSINHIVPWWNSPNIDLQIDSTKAFKFVLKCLAPRKYKAEKQWSSVCAAIQRQLYGPRVLIFCQYDIIPMTTTACEEWWRLLEKIVFWSIN